MYNVYDLRVANMDKQIMDFNRNILKHTVFRMILPTVFFLAVAVFFFVLAAVESGHNNKNSAQFYVFTAVVFLGFFLIYLIRLIKGEKVYRFRKTGRKVYRYLSKEEYRGMLRSYEKTKSTNDA